MNKLARIFYEHFEILSVDSGDLLGQAYRLRYQVLCLEEKIPGFESARYPDGLESDEYDGAAMHSILRHRPTGEVIGTVRLILHDPQRPFPIERNMGTQFDPALIDVGALPRRQTAEISRLILARHFRSRRGEAKSVYGADGRHDFHIPDQRRAPQPFLGLVAAIIRMTSLQGVTHWYAGMEPSLNTSLSRYGLQLQPIGPMGNYHGLRRPYLGVVDEVLAATYFKNRAVWELLTDEGTLWAAPAGVAAASAKLT
jgi:N-acyl amino acid synthase of PEP-CTERM/exosortase system